MVAARHLDHDSLTVASKCLVLGETRQPDFFPIPKRHWAFGVALHALQVIVADRLIALPVPFEYFLIADIP